MSVMYGSEMINRLGLSFRNDNDYDEGPPFVGESRGGSAPAGPPVTGGRRGTLLRLPEKYTRLKMAGVSVPILRLRLKVQEDKGPRYPLASSPRVPEVGAPSLRGQPPPQDFGVVGSPLARKGSISVGVGQ